MARLEPLERGDDKVLALAQFQLAAGKHHEAIAEPSGARTGGEGIGVDALEHAADTGKPQVAQDVRVPGRSRHHDLEMVVTGDHVVGEHHVFEKGEPDVGLTPKPRGGGRFLKVVAQRVQDMDAAQRHFSLGTCQLVFDLLLFRHQGLKQVAVAGVDHVRLHGQQGDRLGCPPAQHLAQQVGPEHAPAVKGGGRPGQGDGVDGHVSFPRGIPWRSRFRRAGCRRAHTGARSPR